MSRSLPLAAWSLRPVAWSLMLAACCFRGLALDAWGLRLDASFLVFCNNLDDARQMSLVFTITHGRDGPVPACAAAFAFIALSRCRAAGVVA